MGFDLFIISLLVFCVMNFAFFLWNQRVYHATLGRWRKALYTLFIGAIGVGLLIDEVSLSNWTFLTSLAILVVFVDLGAILTPSILKIFNAEFKYNDYVESSLETNENIQQGMMKRAGTLSEMIQNARDYFEELPFANSAEEINKQIEDYIGTYSEKYGFSVQLWDIGYFPIGIEKALDEMAITTEDLSLANLEDIDDYMETQGLALGIYETLEKIERVNILDFGKEKESYANALLDFEILSVGKEGHMIVPILTENRKSLIFLKAAKGEILEIDSVHITNLVNLYYTFSQMWYNDSNTTN